MSTNVQNRLNTFLVREVALAFMLTGIFVHIVSAAMGIDYLRQHVFTLTFDLVLFIAIAYSAVGLPLMWRRFDLSQRWKKVTYGVIIAFCLVEIPVHIKIQTTRDTSVLEMAPPGYDYIILPILAFFAWFLLTLKPRQA